MLRTLRLSCALMLGLGVFACKSAGSKAGTAGRAQAPHAGSSAAAGGAGSSGDGRAKAGAEGTAGPQAGGGGFSKNHAGNTSAQAGQGAMPWPRAHVMFQLKGVP
jgi:hypothetical protein